MDHPYLTGALAAWLVSAGAVLVGIDSLNIDGTDGLDRPVHSTLLAHDVPVVEHLCGLEAVPDRGGRFFAVPAKVKAFHTFPGPRVRLSCSAHADRSHPQSLRVQRVGERAHPRHGGVAHAGQLLAPGGASFDSVRDTLVHTMAAQWLYLERWQGRSPRALPEASAFPDLATIRARWDEIERDTQAFVATLDDARLAADLAYTNMQGEPWTYPLWQQMIHQVNHATQHRSEAAVLLTQLGHSPGWLDLLYFVDLRERLYAIVPLVRSTLRRRLDQPTGPWSHDRIDARRWPPRCTRRWRRNLAIVRRRLGRPLTLADKVLLGHLDDPEHQEMEPGRATSSCAPTASCSRTCSARPRMLQFMQTRRDTGRGADQHPLRPPDPGARRGRARPARVARREPARSTTSCSRRRRSTARASGDRARASSTRSCSRTTRSPAR